MQASPYACAVPAILAEMENRREANGNAPQPQALVVDAQETKMDTHPAPRREPAYFLNFLLILFVFVGLDSLNAVLAPTVTITITPMLKTVSTTATVSNRAGADIEGRILPPLTLSQEQTVPATGRGHQDARPATGTLIYFNGAFAPRPLPWE